MRKYPKENWKALGAWIHDARMQGGPEFRDMSAWAKKVGRSERQLYGLERGESVGEKTLEAVAEALYIDPRFLFARLADLDFDDSFPMAYETVRQVKEQYGDTDPDQVAVSLESYTDTELLTEIGRRMKSLRATGTDTDMDAVRGRIDAGMPWDTEQREGDGNADDSPSTSTDASVTRFPKRERMLEDAQRRVEAARRDEGEGPPRNQSEKHGGSVSGFDPDED